MQYYTKKNLEYLDKYYNLYISGYKKSKEINDYRIKCLMNAVWKSATQILPGIILLHAHPQVVYCNHVKFHQYWSIRKGGRVALTKHLDRWTDRVFPITPQTTLFVGGIILYTFVNPIKIGKYLIHVHLTVRSKFPIPQKNLSVPLISATLNKWCSGFFRET